MPDLVKRIDMANHFAELCAQHDITVKFTVAPPEAGAYWARPSLKTIQTRPIRNTGFYVSALHEIGHCIGCRQTRHWSTLMREFYAWKWSKEHAIIWTDTAQRVMARALTGYKESATPAQIAEMPDSFHDIWIEEGQIPANRRIEEND